MRSIIFRCGVCKEILSDKEAKDPIADAHVHIKGLLEIAYPARGYYRTASEVQAWTTKSLGLEQHEDQVHFTCLVVKLKEVLTEIGYGNIGPRIKIEKVEPGCTEPVK